MESKKVRIELDDLEDLAEDLEHALEPIEAAEIRDDGARSAWTDGFRASGSKHAIG